MQSQEKFTARGGLPGIWPLAKTLCHTGLGKQRGGLQLSGPTGRKAKNVGMGLDLHRPPDSGGTEYNNKHHVYL